MRCVDRDITQVDRYIYEVNFHGVCDADFYI